jgi:hypothetical protein
MTTPTPSNDATLRVTPSAPVTPAYPSESQFAPGTMIAGRYRVVSMLGKGGMGEVYRADDLKLGQPVALKFLPRAYERDAMLLAQLHEEVRMGRQITHPNVCRIYDIGEEASGHFVAMELVDGEDLGRLLRRIGRLPPDKAAEIARGIAAGLAAAHAKGILHRDLKPANVMVDGDGEARITDFGLAMPAHEAIASSIVVGTPAYLAPEQLQGEAATVQSDLYAFGLVMYEMFTGRRARAGRTLRELAEEVTTEIALPSTHVRELDPAIERIITRCLERDPARRPGSAREVFDALPGGDRLAAAVAAGQTPSPRAVAAAGEDGTLSLMAAWSWAGAFAVLLACALGIASQWRIMNLRPFDKAPAVLDEKAAEIAEAVGVTAGAYRNSGFTPNHNYLSWIERNDRSPQRFAHLDRGPAPVRYWTRSSTAPLTPLSDRAAATEDDPPRQSRDDTLIELDPAGRLITLAAAPPRASRRSAAEWSPLFAFAKLDPAKLHAVAPRGLPPLFAEERAAWDGVWPDDPSKPLHVEAAANRGVPVWFRVSGPWDDRAAQRAFSNTALSKYLTLLIALMVALAAVLAWRNFRLRRGDRRGAVRVAALVVVIEVVAGVLLGDHHLTITHELSIVVGLLRYGLFEGALFAFFYLALEPTIRRRAPHLLIGWSRFLAGNYRDPLVGRDILIGAVAGVLHGVIAAGGNWLPGRLGWGLPSRPHVDGIGAILGFRFVLGWTVNDAETALFFAFGMTILLAGMLLLLRRRWAAVTVLYLMQATGYVFASHGDPTIIVGGLLLAALATALTVLVGPLGLIANHIMFALTFLKPVSIDFASPYAVPLMTPLVLAAAIVVFAFRTSLGRQPVFGAIED